jgi:hypothetical protein
VYAYHHDDSDLTPHELEEFFSYVEVPGVASEGKDAWDRGGFDWLGSDSAAKVTLIAHLLEQLDLSNTELRFEAARRLSYIAQGD